MRHGVRNALIPVVTVLGIDIGAVLGGLIITEAIFDYPGMGEFFLKAPTTATSRSLMPYMVIIVVLRAVLQPARRPARTPVLDPRIRLD